MSFGVGVGDILKLVTLANKLRKDFSNAPAEYLGISSEIKNCSLILQEIDVYLEGHEVSASEIAGDLEKVIARSDQVLNDVEKAINKYSKLEKSGGTIRGRAQRIWQRATWDPDNVRDVRNRLNAVVIQLNAIAEGFNRQNVTKLVERQAEQINQEVLDWLTPPDYASQHNDHIRFHLPGTGKWFIESPSYRQWKKTKDSTRMLMLSGIPGAGKTVLSSIIIDSLQESCKIEANTRLCYYYCDYNRLQNQKLDTILLCLLRQLVQPMSILPTAITLLHETCSKTSSRPTLASVKDAFREIVGALQKVYIVIDALDESQTANGFRRELLIELLELGTLTNISLLVTSRPLPDILNTLKKFTCIEVRADETDIVKYVDTNIPNLPAFVGRKPALQDDIKKAVVAASDGIFLLATLYTKSLVGSVSARQLQKIMTSFGHGASGYNEAYEKTMARICGQVHGQKELAIDALRWIVYAERLLTCEELVHALATEPDDLEFYDDNVSDIEDVLTACCGLLILEEKTNLVRLVHRTTQEFFKEDGQSWLPEPQTRISKVCNAYLGFIKPLSGEPLSHEAFEGVLSQYPLYNYATLHWLQHTKQRETPITVQEALDQQQQVVDSSQAFLNHLIPQYFELSQSTPGITGLHLVAYHGIIELLPSFLDRYDINSVDKLGNTALSYATRQSQEESVKLLIDNGANFLHPDDQGRIPLSYAVERDDQHLQRFLKLITNKADPNAMRLQALSSDKNGLTPVMYAAKKGRQSALEFLLESGANINSCDKDKNTAVLHAMNAGYEETAFWLISRGASPNPVNNIGRSLLIQAAGFGQEETVRRLIELGADLNVTDRCGRNALHRALLLDGHKLYDYFLSTEMDCDVKDACGMGALEYACLGWSCPADVMEVFLDAETKERMETWENAIPLLHLACRASDFDTLRTLSGYDFRMLPMSTKEPSADWSPLDVAIYWGNNKLVKTDGQLREDLPWDELEHTGLVIEADKLSWLPYRKNTLQPGIKTNNAICDYCLFSPRGLYFQCIHCIESGIDAYNAWTLCHFCKWAAEKLHPGYKWKTIEILE